MFHSLAFLLRRDSFELRQLAVDWLEGAAATDDTIQAAMQEAGWTWEQYAKCVEGVFDGCDHCRFLHL
jgi:hypothetical protein